MLVVPGRCIGMAGIVAFSENGIGSGKPFWHWRLNLFLTNIDGRFMPDAKDKRQAGGMGQACAWIASLNVFPT